MVRLPLKPHFRSRKARKCNVCPQSDRLCGQTLIIKNHNLLMSSIVLVLALVFAFAIAFTTCSNPAGPDEDGFTEDTSTQDTAWYDNAAPGQTEFTISAADELAGLAKLVNDGNNFLGKTVKLLNNLDLSDYGAGKSFNDGKGWMPIGYNYYYRRFNGEFNGNSKAITGLSINNVGDSDYQDLFGTIDSKGVVKNLLLDDVNIISSKADVGGVAGYNYGGKVVNCYASGSVEGIQSIGGIVGQLGGKGEVVNCYAAGDIICTEYLFGGIVGNIMDGSVVMNCVALNDGISGGIYEGRIVGYISGIKYGTSNNYGRVNIPGGIWSMGSIILNGADISPSGAENTQEWWANGATDDPPGPGFNFVNVWKMGENSLPVFK